MLMRNFTILILTLFTLIPVFSVQAAQAPTSPVIKKEKIKSEELITNTFRECMNEATKDGKPAFEKEEVDGRNWSIITMDCAGDRAKALYEAIGPHSEEQYVKYSDGRRGIARFFGNLLPPSQCSRVTGTAKGVEMNFYSCSIRVDIKHELVREMKL